MTPVVEVQTAEEVRRALAVFPRVMLINNRDLTTFQIDLSTTERLAPLISEGMMTISASGIQNRFNIVGQALLAAEMGKRRFIAETGAGQHGVAEAMVGALMGMRTEIYMGEVDTERQKPNVFRMRLLGATVHPVETGGRTLKNAINEALRDWIANLRDTHYLLGTAAGRIRSRRWSSFSRR